MSFPTLFPSGDDRFASSANRRFRGVSHGRQFALGLVMCGCACSSERPQLERVQAENARLVSQLGGLQALASKKDSLFADLASTTKLVNEIEDRLREVRALRLRPRSGSRSDIERRSALSRAELLAKIDELVARLAAAEARSAERRITAEATDPSLRAQVAEYESTIAEFRLQVDRQRLEIEQLGGRVRTLEAERVQLARSNSAMADSMLSIREEQNTVYYIAGTRDELLELGVIALAGKGGRVFGIGPKREQHLVVSRTLDASDFTPLNRDSDIEIKLPRPDRSYRILSLQDTRALAGGVPRDGDVRGAVRIANAVTFWAPTSYLILMEHQ